MNDNPLVVAGILVLVACAAFSLWPKREVPCDVQAARAQGLCQERTQRECTDVYKLRYETCVETRGGS